MFDLTGKTALVTGASGGIGGAIAKALAKQGARVALSGTRVEALEKLRGEIGGDHPITPCNLSDGAAVDALIGQAEQALGGRLDILVANAGITKDGLLLRMKDEDFQNVLKVNLESYFRLSRAALRNMMKNRWGRIIGITSVVGVTGNPGQANYAASKAGMIGFTKALAAEVASRNVKVLVTGNPANTNALLAQRNAPDLAPECFSAMTMLDHTRAVSQLAAKCGVPTKDVKNVTVWGNHSCMQYPDLHHAKVKGVDALSLVEHDWFVDDFIPTVQHRGTEVIKVRGASSAASAANAAIKHMSTWIHGTDEGDWVSMAVPSDGSYGIEDGLVYSFPCRVIDGQYQIVKGLDLNEFSLERLRQNEVEVREEMLAIKHML